MSEGVNDNNEIIDVASIYDKDDFVKLDADVQNKIIDGKRLENRHKLGYIAELFGTNPMQIAMYGALIIASAMVIVIFLEFLCSRISGYEINMELIEKTFSVLILILGYLFGKGRS